MWEKLLKFLGFRAQARLSGASAAESNQAAAVAVALEEVTKKAEQEAKKQ